MRGKLTAILVGSLLSLAGPSLAEDSAWWKSDAAVKPSDPNDSGSLLSAVTLGKPVPLTTPATPSGGLTPVSFFPDYSNQHVARAQNPNPASSTIAVPGAAITNEQYNCGVANQPAGAGPGFWDGCKDVWTKITGLGAGAFDSDHRHGRFESDQDFNDFSSPVSNPFFFEDPRSLTEIRPIYIHNATPLRNSAFNGGNIEWFGLQGRLALTEHWSIVVNKLGGISMDERAATSDLTPHTGFSELFIGPKWTFYRNESSGTLIATGLIFELPAGDKTVAQDTGSLTLAPYLSFGQRFWKSDYGTFHAMSVIGYNFAVDSVRSDSLYSSLHIDYDIANAHKFYPLIELNSFFYSTNGNKRDFNFEGRDLANFGSRFVSGHDEFSLAAGMRYKLSERIQFGLVGEIPLTGKKDTMDYRVTADMIIRY